MVGVVLGLLGYDVVTLGLWCYGWIVVRIVGLWCGDVMFIGLWLGCS